MGRSPSASAHPQLPGCLARGQSSIWEAGPGTPGLTLVVLDQLLQRVEVVSWGDVEATAVQSPDLVMLHCPAPQVVPVPHRERVRAWAGRGELAPPKGAHSCCPWPSRGPWHAQSHRPAEPAAPIPLCCHHPFSPRPDMPASQTPKAASKGHISLSLPWGWDIWQQQRLLQGHFQKSRNPPVLPCSTADPQGWGGSSSSRQRWMREALWAAVPHPCAMDTPPHLLLSRCPLS